MNIRLQEELREGAAGDESRGNEQQIPADETYVEAEVAPLVPVHYATGLRDALVRRPVGMVDCDIRRHRVGKALDDTGNDEQEEPELQVCPLDANHPEHVPAMAPAGGKKLELHAPAHRRKRHRGIRPRHEADQVEQRN